MVLHKYGNKLYDGLTTTMTNQLQKVAGQVDAAQGDTFLEELNSRWLDHNKSLQMIRDILMYMDRTYVTNQNKVPVHELGLNLWRDFIVRNARIKDRLLKTLLDLVHKERTGEVINRWEVLLFHVFYVFFSRASWYVASADRGVIKR